MRFFAIFATYWLSKTRQPCDFYDFLQTREKSQFLQLLANLDISAIFLVYAYKIFTIFNTHDDNACDNFISIISCKIEVWIE